MNRYREDIKMWETETKFWFIRYYRYEVWENGKTITKIRLFKMKRKCAKYFQFKELQEIRIGKAEFKEKYNNNKWIVPVNRIIDLTLP